MPTQSIKLTRSEEVAEGTMAFHFTRPSAFEFPYEELDLQQPWETYNIGHELTTKGLDKFVADYRKALAESAGGA